MHLDPFAQFYFFHFNQYQAVKKIKLLFYRKETFAFSVCPKCSTNHAENDADPVDCCH